MPKLISEKTVKARKPHRCLCCGVVAIKPGDAYHRETYVYDGRVYNWVSCSDCASLVGDVWDWCWEPEEGIGADQYCEWAHEHPHDPRATAYLARAGVDQ